MATGNVKIRIWDVKHGNAIFIRTPNNKHLVYDLGRGDYSENSEDRSPLETLYDHYNIRVIDYLMITHPHKDHIDDILNLGKFTVRSLHRPKNLNRTLLLNGANEGDQKKIRKFIELDDHYSIPASQATTISNPENFGGMIFKVFQTTELPESNLNNRSLLSSIEFEGLKIVIPGDNEYASLDLLMKRDDFRTAVKDADILLAPHHGRESAYHADFVSLVNPRITVISDGSIVNTSANPKYSSKSRGWVVKNKSEFKKRFLLTTNCDGEIYIDFGRRATDQKLYLTVETKYN
ncbi:hypothetical protein GCM10022246_40430 [Pedobacter ginsengiterrae]|uniref:Metallo-beta-lactamase domain-containing protein n=1 Tax=Pedobacter ginsengiterrae TaxID=871696 RepID=A0ABP7QLJ2_9SPHI